MPANGPESKTPQPGSLQAMLARLRGMVQALKSPDAVGTELQASRTATVATR